MPDFKNVRVITHGAIRIEGAKGTVVYYDPFGLTDADATHDAGYVLITHTHFDHLSPEDVARVANKQTVVVAPASAAADAEKLRSSSVRLMSPGDTLELPGIHIEAVPAYNTDPSRLANHPQANGWLGYVVTLDGEPTRYFVAGDTDQNADNERVSCDVALLPIGGTYTCDARQAAAFANALHPQAVIPTHYGSIVGTRADADVFAAEVDPVIAVLKKLER